jgi:RNA polymerase sigma-70 factor, ECF subfamily
MCPVVGLVFGEADCGLSLWIDDGRTARRVSPRLTSIESDEADALPMLPLNPDSTLDLSLLSDESLPIAPREAGEEVLQLFDRHAAQLGRYAASFGLRADESEDIVQEVFLALFRHLRLGRSRRNLGGWLFQVAHNLALKQRRRTQRRATASWDAALHELIDPAANPETQFAHRQRRLRLAPVIHALPARDRRCLLLRAEGLRYRDIAHTLGISLGAVAKSLARSMTRLVNADRG